MSMRRCNNLALAALLGLAAAPIAHAQAPTWSFSGYGTAGVVHSDDDQADYLVDAFKPSGPGHTRKWDPEVDSRIAGQVAAQFTPKFSGVVQVVMQQRHDDTWKPKVEWANLTWHVTEDFSLRAGRVVLPVFMLTDTRKVGYAYPWVRPPVEMYSLVPVTSNDGIEASWRLAAGDTRTTLQATTGRSESPFPSASGFGEGRADVRDLVKLAATVENGPFSVRLDYGQARLTIATIGAQFDIFRAFGPAGEAIADRFNVTDRRVTFVGLGGSYDPGPWFAMGEWARFDTRSIIGKKEAWYVSAGARFGKLTPYATYARVRMLSDRSHPGLPLAGLPPELAAAAGALNAALNMQLAVGPMQETTSVGLRWDVLKSAALKLQYDRVDVGAGSTGTFGNRQPGFEGGKRVGIFSASVDFVF
jgi:hypothetical protein